MAKFLCLNCAFTIFLFIQLASGLQFGSRGLNHLHIRQENNEPDAGNSNKNENHNRNTKIENKILRSFTNKEFLFADEDISETKNIENSKTVKTDLLAPTIKVAIEEKRQPSEIDAIDSKLHRQQRTNINQVPEEFENMMFTFYKV